MKMKPVFSDKERDTERDLDITTVSKVIETKEIPIPNMVTKEEAESIARQYADQASEHAVNTALERYDSRRREDEDRRRKEEEDKDSDRKRRRRDEEEVNDGPIISSKTVNELKNIAGIFNALKEFSANPLQKAIEGKVGDVAAGVVERAFGPPSQHQEKDIIDRILNSQFATGLGAGLGQRGPELVDTFTKNFGKEKVGGWISGAVKGGGSGTDVMGGIGSVIGGGMSGTQLPPPVQEKQQSEMEMILGLDRNNPEHVAAYAKSQGDITVGTARKILMIHQDDFISQLESKGVDATPYKLRRGQSQSQSQNISSQNQDLASMPEGGNMQEYRRPPPRVNEDLMVNTPATEDKRWESEDEKSDVYVNNLETQNVELHPQMERVERRIEKKVDTIIDNNSSENINTEEIANYLKSLNESITGLKDMVERQQQQQNAVQQQQNAVNNDMFNLRQELDVIKKGDRPEVLEVEGRDDNQTTTVRSTKTIKKGFAHVRTD